MALPRKLKNLNMFADGVSWIGEIGSATLPKLTRKMEEFRGGGMNGPVDIDHGMEKLVLEFSCGGYMRQVVAQFGATSHDALQYRFAGAYQNDQTGEVDALEVVVRGRIMEIDRGDSKVADDTEFKGKVTCSYYREILNGEDVAEFDFVNMVEIVDGVDRLADQRAAIGA